MKQKNKMDQKMIVAIVLGVLLMISVVQAFQLNSVKEIIADGQLNVGTASKKENSTIAFLFNPKIKPPIMVAAALETPGTIAIIWKTPTKKHCKEEGFSPKNADSAMWASPALAIVSL